MYGQRHFIRLTKLYNLLEQYSRVHRLYDMINAL